jgi:hypothetical protein
LAAERHQIEQLRQSFTTEKAALTALADSRRAEHHEAQKALQVAHSRSADAEAALKAERKTTSAAMAATEKQIAERDRRIADIQREIERVRSQWEGNETHWLKEIDHLRTDLKSRQSELDKQSRGFERQRSEFESRLAAEQERRKEAEQKCRVLETTLAKERREHLRELKARSARSSTARKRVGSGR